MQLKSPLVKSSSKQCEDFVNKGGIEKNLFLQMIFIMRTNLPAE